MSARAARYDDTDTEPELWVDVVTLDEQIAEVKRELRVRGRVFNGLVRTGRLDIGEAGRRTERMRAALETLEIVKADETLSDRIAGVVALRRAGGEE